MKIKVEKEELNTINKIIDDDKTELENKLDYLLSLVNDLKTVWQGTDAEEFYNKAETYITFLRSVPTIYGSIYNVIDGANKTYTQLDTDYAETMKKAVVAHE